ncbi:hypothetical protein TNCV_703101 [Trichonephila clavipes]|nr:hypothetical protein TNCV_703101 [Trichonephila clavipes]
MFALQEIQPSSYRRKFQRNSAIESEEKTQKEQLPSKLLKLKRKLTWQAFMLAAAVTQVTPSLRDRDGYEI